MGRIRMLAPLVPKADGRTVRPEPKRADPFYHTQGHGQFRDVVFKRAGSRCEWIEDGKRCDKAAPQHRLFADHIRERRDGGDHDPSNGMCLCGSHHTIKTQRERARRLAGHGGGGG